MLENLNYVDARELLVCPLNRPGFLVEEIIPEDAVRVTIRKDPEQGFDYRKITVKGFRGFAGEEEKAGKAEKG